MKNTLSGRVSAIQRLSSGDGPGMRSTVFFKGCPLRCSWCHNPETWEHSYTIAWKKNKCIACDCCINACPQGALAFEEDGLHLNKEKCIKCAQCSSECPSKALQCYGRDYGLEQLVHELSKDKLYYQNSGGGVTLSGGEVLLQAPFVSELAKQLKAEAIPVALDTCCYGKKEDLLQLASLCDLFLIDIKLIDPEKHQQFTGKSNQLILENILALATFLRQNPQKSLQIRTPIIPGFTDSPDNIDTIAKFISENLLDVIDRWELILYHDMCKEKYSELWLPWPHEHTPLVDKSHVNTIISAASAHAVPQEKIHVLGLAVDIE